MSNDETFTILSVGAPLVEVVGEGPATNRPDGLTVPDGVPVTAPVHLLDEWVRYWCVDAAARVAATVTITDSPFGAFIDVNRCVPRPIRWWHPIGIDQWPRLRDPLRRRLPLVAALWTLFTDESLMPCSWTNVGETSEGPAAVRGGDVIRVTFVTP